MQADRNYCLIHMHKTKQKVEKYKPALAFLHKSAVDLIPEMQWAKDKIKCDADIRSMCSAGFAEAFFQNNR